jgi:hypothetical protein
MKIYNFAFIGSCTNETSYCFDQIPTCWTCNENELKEVFKRLKCHFLKHFHTTQKGGLQSYKNYKFGLTITIIDVEKDEAKNRSFYINPLNLNIQ